MKALAMSAQTMVGYGGDFPRSKGNCFSMVVENSLVGFHAVNFNAENLLELIKRGVVDWPIEISPLTEGHALIVDERIPQEWYKEEKDWCTICYRRKEQEEVRNG